MVRSKPSSVEELEAYRKLLHVNLQGALQPQQDQINAAAADLPLILRDLMERDVYLPHGNPDPQGKIIAAEQLAYKVAGRGHDCQVAGWAIYQLIARGFLGAEIATVNLPKSPARTEPSRRKREKLVKNEAGPRDIIRGDERIAESVSAYYIPTSNKPGPVYGITGQGHDPTVPQTGVSYTPYSYLVVWPTDELWEWWQHCPSAALSLPKLQGTSTAEPSQVPVARSQHVILYGLDDEPVVKGKKKKPLTARSYNLVKQLIEAAPRGASMKQLEKISTGYWRALRELRKDPDWAAVIHMAGQAHQGYRID